MKACNDPECCVSTGICGNLTFGKGELCDYGYWEHPCRPCMKADAIKKSKAKEESLVCKYN